MLSKLFRAKVIVADFDDTLILHDCGKDWYSCCYDGVCMRDYSKLFENSVPNYALLEALKLVDAPKFCLTHAGRSTHLFPKKDWLNLFATDMFKDIICVGSREDKAKFILDMCDAYGFKPEEVCLIDDHPDTLYEAGMTGITVITPQRIMNEMYKQRLVSE